MHFCEKLAVFGFEDGLDTGLVSTAKTVQLDWSRNISLMSNKILRQNIKEHTSLSVPSDLIMITTFTKVYFSKAESKSASNFFSKQTPPAGRRVCLRVFSVLAELLHKITPSLFRLVARRDACHQLQVLGCFNICSLQ